MFCCRQSVVSSFYVVTFSCLCMWMAEVRNSQLKETKSSSTMKGSVPATNEPGHQDLVNDEKTSKFPCESV